MSESQEKKICEDESMELLKRSCEIKKENVKIKTVNQFNVKMEDWFKNFCI